MRAAAAEDTTVDTSVGVTTFLAPSKPGDAAIFWGGFTFTVTGSTGVTASPRTVTTGDDPDPDIVFSDVSYDSQNTSPTVTLVPTPRDGYVLAQQGGANAVCSTYPADPGTPSESVPVTNVGDTGFTIAVSPTQVDCSVFYTQLPGPPRLTLEDRVVNDDGGTAVATDWVLEANGPLRVAGPMGDLPVTNVKLVAGTYVLGESGPSGYTPGTWSCDGGTMTNAGTLLLKDGDGAVCTITNDDQPTRLTLVNKVTNDNGGTAQPADWTLFATGPTTITGRTGDSSVTGAAMKAGTYTLDDSGPSGYAGVWSCTSSGLTGSTLVLGAGDDVTCTLTDDDRAAQLTLIDEVTNDNGGSARPADWTLTATGPTPISGHTGDTSVTEAPVNAGTYALSDAGPPGYAGAWSCTSDDIGYDRIRAASSAAGSTVVLNTADSVTCTLTDDDRPAHLTLITHVVNDNGGTAQPSDWTLSATGPTPISGHTGDRSITDATVNAGTYSLGEAGPAGYTGRWSCSPGALTGSTLAVATGDDVTCVATNDDRPAHLTLIEHSVNDNGGTARPSDWTLTATGPTPITGHSGDPTVTDIPVDPGSYRLAEARGPAGYAQSPWVCRGGFQEVPGGPVLLGNGQSATCTVTNDDRPATLTLITQVANGSSGGSATPGQWTTSAAGPTSISGQGNSPAVTDQTIDAGSYLLSESGGPRGYAAGSWSCAGGTLAHNRLTVTPGADVVCTIVDSAQQPALTLIKLVHDGGSGVATPGTAWQLSAVGPRTISGVTGSAAVTRVPLPVGTYDLTESGPAGFRSSDWLCTGADGFTPGGTVTLSLGDHASCTSTSTATAPTLTLVAAVDNGLSRGTAGPTDWMLSALGHSAGIQGVSGSSAVTQAPAVVGTYSLSETGPQGYLGSGWVCTGATASTATSVTLDIDEHATCTITNTAQQPHLTLLDEVRNDDGGHATPGDWTLAAAGPTPGIGGSGGVSNVPAAAGAYRLTESGPDGYRLRGWSCAGGVLQGSTVLVALGNDVTCVAHLDDAPSRPALTLSPNLVWTPVGSRFAVTAELRAAGKAVPDVTVRFASRMDGEDDETGASTTDPAGRARFGYTRAVAGTDTVTAKALVDGQTVVATIRHHWTSATTDVPPTSRTVTPQEVARPGGSLQLSGTGCRPGEVVRVDLRNVHGQEFELGTTRAALDGSFYLSASVPDLPLGRYTLGTSCGKPTGDPTVDLTGPESTLGMSGIAAVGATTGSLFAFFVLLVKGVVSFMPRRFG